MSKAKRHNREWTPHDIKRMRSKARAGLSAREASKELGRTMGAVKYKAMVEGIRFKAINQPKGPQLKLAARRRKYGPHATLRGRQMHAGAA
jgi:hypothetical protein